jgi:hypothetical protein
MDSKAELTPARIMQVGTGFFAAKVLLSAVEIGIFTELSNHPQTLDELTGRMGLHSRSARDFLDSLTALGFLQRSNGIYSNTAETDFFLDRNKDSYIGGVLEMANARLYRFWGHLTEALRTGQPQNEIKENPNAPPFSALYADPARLKSFLSAMSGISRTANQAIARKVPWHRYKTYADAGTAQGDLVVQIALANPHLQGIGYDLPEVGPIFEEYVRVNGVSDRVRFRAGDFFAEDLPKVDVITMGHILHDWNLKEKKMLVARALKALNPDGAYVVYDAIIDDDRSKNAFGLLMSLNMLIETPGGFDYTGAECIGWMKEAGFREARVEDLGNGNSIVIGIK